MKYVEFEKLHTHTYVFYNLFTNFWHAAFQI